MKQQQKSIETLIKGQQLMQQNINKIFEKIDILIGSDTADIKMAIAQAYQTFCIERKCIDMYSLESLERRFEYYQKQGGNSFVASLMNQIKALPKVTTPPPAQQ